MTEKEVLLSRMEREFPTTLKVLRAYPAAKAALKPTPKANSAHELAHAFVFGAKGSDMTLDGALEFGEIPSRAPTFADEIATYETLQRGVLERLRRTPDAELNQTVKFMTGPGRMEDMRRIDVLWLLLMDAVHHRGQMSVYLRLADAKVPSIYGPTADEPWR
jgi:hypothetical protein